MEKLSSVVLHIPHSSVLIPDKDRSVMLIDDILLANNLLRLTDWFTDELFCINGVNCVINKVSRLVCDPERFRDDKDELMSRYGMGAAYERCLDGQLLRRLTVNEREETLKKYYDPHHLKLESSVEAALKKTGSCLVVDCHSFPSAPLPFEADKHRERPDICIGTDSYHTPSELINATKEYFIQRNLSVKENFPFAGTIVPLKYYRKNKRVLSVMIEVNRYLYMDENTGMKNAGFSRIAGLIRKYIEQLASDIIS